MSLIILTALNILTLGFTKLTLNTLTVRVCVSNQSHSPQHSHFSVYIAHTQQLSPLECVSPIILTAINILTLEFTKLTLNTHTDTVECVSLINLTALNILTLGFTMLTLNTLTVRMCVSSQSHSPQHSHTRVYKAHTQHSHS